MNTYSIPKPEGYTNTQYYDYVHMLDVVFNNERALQIDPIAQEVTIDGSITGFTPLPPKPLPPYLISKIDFMDRFTNDELATLISSTIPMVMVIVKKFDEATEIDINSPKTIDAANGLEALGIIGAGRASIILTKN
jgi:hypothetical protein